MAKINERNAIVEDQPQVIGFPSIRPLDVQYLLTYEASRILHTRNLRATIVNMLQSDQVGAYGLKCFTNSAIHFKMRAPFTKNQINNLNNRFAVIVTILKHRYPNSTIFWTFNVISSFAEPNEQLKSVIKGRGNRSLNERFQELL